MLGLVSKPPALGPTSQKHLVRSPSLLLCRRFNFEFVKGPQAVGMATGATIHTAHGLHVKLSRRETSGVSAGSPQDSQQPVGAAA